MCECNFRFICFIFFTLFLCVCIHVDFCRGGETEESLLRLAQSQDCGYIDEVDGDWRTLIPWTAAIFKKSKNFNSNGQYKFLISGVVIGPSTVLSLAGGAYGQDTSRSTYSFTTANNTLIAVGLKSTRLNDEDQFSQFVEVNYVLPHILQEKDNKEYHLFIYHLKRPLNLKTPYVREICLPLLYQHLPQSNPFGQFYTQGGFTNDYDRYSLQVFSIVSESEVECSRAFKYYYKKSQNSSYIFCGRRVADGNFHRNSTTCLTYGSAVVYSVDLMNNGSTEVFQRWFLGGLTALIPSKKRQRCNQNSIYFYAQIANRLFLSWMLKTLQCSPKRFPCEDGTCLPLSNVCNSVPDCPTASLQEEDPIYCKITNSCELKPHVYQCGLYGSCIPEAELCNGKAQNSTPCIIESTSHKAICKFFATRDQRSEQTFISSDSEEPVLIMQSKKKMCSPLEYQEGVIANCELKSEGNLNAFCTNFVKPGTTAILKCSSSYVSTTRRLFAERYCKDDGSWDNSDFSCEPECGILSSDFVRLKSQSNLPWHASIFVFTEGNFMYSCGATLIEKTMLLTAAQCIQSGGSQRNNNESGYTKYKIVLGTVSNRFLENSNSNQTQISNIKRVWIPPTFNSQSLRSDIAVLEISHPVTYNDFVRPACYLRSGYNNRPAFGEIGKLAVMTSLNNTFLSSVPNSTDVTITALVDCEAFNNTSAFPSKVFCAAYNSSDGGEFHRMNHGAGIVFLSKHKTIQNERVSKYFIQGIASLTQVSYNLEIVFTHVDSFADWIINLMEHYAA